ncbi:MAG TPA: hypothetical protein ENO08_05420 [Candidatus Eisenbacteria bacterium]|uniref:Glycosyltransferase RgtA/B/C/D-like domain-containing protein n=1 Tax=Eiseniibacteriota bacterium TaxID=2212470 RepID=A0A7V2F3H1_UNCEI|nr:hypothetical protein [Candidatus Eisenbacteria bacterium]
MKTPGRIDIAALCAAAAVMIFLYGAIDYEAEPYSGMDLAYYRAMSEAAPRLAPEIPRPFAYRILGPYIAGLVPLSDRHAFFLITAAASILLPVVFYLFLLEFGISRRSALLAAILLLFNKHLFGTGVWNFFQVKDSISLLVVTAAFLAMLRSRWLLFSCLLLVGALTGETALIMAPTLALYLFERKRPARDRAAALAGLAPAAAAFVLIRLLVPATGGEGLADTFLRYSPKLRFPAVWVGLLLNPFVPLTFIPLLYLRDALSFLDKNRYMALYLLLVFASALFGSNNERLMAPAAIVFYAFIGSIAERRWREEPGLWAFIAFCCFASSFHHMMGRYPLPSRSATRTAAALTTLLATGASYLFSRSQKGSGFGRNLAP